MQLGHVWPILTFIMLVGKMWFGYDISFWWVFAPLMFQMGLMVVVHVLSFLFDLDPDTGRKL